MQERIGKYEIVETIAAGGGSGREARKSVGERVDEGATDAGATVMNA